ncbi:MAG: methyltransferase domain-containing protein [Oscillospiraceae bacterium]|nr:methyltransferase domain-containing protein [Oscillospiraceae bacterium]
MNIEHILMCPKCHCGLSKDLECKMCHHVYNHKNGVYDIVSESLSNDQEILWHIPDEMIEGINLSNDSGEFYWAKDYNSRKNDETIKAEKQLFDYSVQSIETFSGVVCDMATGRGRMLQMLIDSKNKNFDIVCTDIDRKILMLTRKVKQTDDNRVHYIATDGRYLSIKNNSFDYITSFAAFGNIPEGEKVAKELYRVLKESGKLIIFGTFIEKDSKSFEIAKSRNLEKGLVEEYLIKDLEDAGFKNINSVVVDKAIWAENPYDLLPAAGDMNYYCVIESEKSHK